ncbi:triphosphoribosyl-dephospho-CoA synthase [Piscinibacter sp. XHJ-5]|uniref:triphosphoribosyl-dephospho-CoA synthase n=1 Tax=Piscinibacter sp. XHJ-5 TaxID=3037797 RepID=UPI00245301AB|nr:triphosphoribosyl-dephospho-CoA synthase [Piscinibacter sp. XHJ-5]
MRPGHSSGGHEARDTVSADPAFLWACHLDVAARKAGNVGLASPGHGMQAEQFIASAAACAGPLCRPGAAVGARIESAVQASWAVAGCNTNLGIVLLCAPLAAAHERRPPTGGVQALRRALAEVLQGLDVADARAAYRAIALARPGGLGSSPEQDVAAPPTVDLRTAMSLAAHRDRIAFQYVHGHADVFELGLPAFDASLHAARRAGAPDDAAAATAMQRVYLEFLSAFPDSHIVRKHGWAVAHSVMAEAAAWRTRARRGEPLDDDPGYVRWDEDLKSRALNPGTSADLSVAVAFASALCGRAPLDARTAGEPSVSTESTRHGI